MRILLLTAMLSFAANAAEWSQPAEVRHDDKLVLTYRAKLEGDYLIVRAAIEPGWHTFVMDNKRREQEKLAGKPSLGIEKSTEVEAIKGLALTPPWLQATPKDMSQPEIRHFTWGYEREAIFAAKARRTGAGPAEVNIEAQACAADICKNIDVTLTLPSGSAKAGASDIVNIKTLIPVR
jgi:DsbC/DsbD-like thiol-disulfide interchange protein